MKRVLAITGVLAALLAGLVLAQDDDIIRVDVNLVNLFFSAREKGGAYLKDVKQSDITTYEDGKRQEIKVFSREVNLPLTIGMLIDVSRSQEALMGEERRAGAQFFKQILGEKDLAFLISFGAEVELLQDFTGSARLLEKGLSELRISTSFSGLGPIPVSKPKGTVMFDAVYLAAGDQLNGQVGRKVLVLITDGADVGSHYKLRDAVDAAHRADAIIYSVFYADPRYGAYPGGDLERLSQETGGRMFEVGRGQSLQQIFDAIQEEMRSQYTLAYTSTNPARDGGFRKIEIKPANKNTRIQARKGYFAASN